MVPSCRLLLVTFFCATRKSLETRTHQLLGPASMVREAISIENFMCERLYEIVLVIRVDDGPSPVSPATLSCKGRRR